MSEYSGFMKSVKTLPTDAHGDRLYASPIMAMILQDIGQQRNGVLYGNLIALQPYCNGSDFIIRVKTGSALINGYYYKLDAEKALTPGAAHTTYARIDRIVARLDLTSSARTITAMLLAGTPAASPAPPALSNTSTVIDIELGQVTIDANATTISAGKVQDMRSFVFDFPTNDGWSPVPRTMTYVSATQITLKGNWVGILQLGDKLRYKQGGSYKYNNIVSASPSYNAGTDLTTVNIHSGYQTAPGDCNFANSAITDFYYSHGDSAAGFPSGFNFLPDLAGGTVSGTFGATCFSTRIGRFSISGQWVKAQVHLTRNSTAAGGSPSGTVVVINMPVTSRAGSPFVVAEPHLTGINWGTSAVSAELLNYGNSTNFELIGNLNNAAYANSDITTVGNGDVIAFRTEYEMAA